MYSNDERLAVHYRCLNDGKRSPIVVFVLCAFFLSFLLAQEPMQTTNSPHRLGTLNLENRATAVGLPTL